MDAEKKKLAYLIQRVRGSSEEIHDALAGEWFDSAEEVLHAFVENSGETWDQWIAAQGVMERDEFLEHWEPSDDYLRN